MYWLQRPPYLRRLIAVLVVGTALLWDLHSAATQPFPVSSRAIGAGTTIGADDVDWVELPQGRLPAPALEGAVAAVDIAPGEPLTQALFAGPVAVPPGWWTVPVAIGTLGLPGDAVLLMITEPAMTISGLVIEAQSGNVYDLDFEPAVIAIPEAMAPLVAAAEQSGVLVTAVKPSANAR